MTPTTAGCSGMRHDYNSSLFNGRLNRFAHNIYPDKLITPCQCLSTHPSYSHVRKRSPRNSRSRAPLDLYPCMCPSFSIMVFRHSHFTGLLALACLSPAATHLICPSSDCPSTTSWVVTDLLASRDKFPINIHIPLTKYFDGWFVGFRIRNVHENNTVFSCSRNAKNLVPEAVHVDPGTEFNDTALWNFSILDCEAISSPLVQFPAPEATFNFSILFAPPVATPPGPSTWDAPFSLQFRRSANVTGSV